ncbi:DegT/DnrJ/EryC1/StrS family aminotransferase, partial [Legionella pneumophila]|uniref:DegT/DnrJ/EryC1/StrS family aminotransferase n=1 Tax=Legionella pneumophila TaxID=446 RepID=UPI0038CFF01B
YPNRHHNKRNNRRMDTIQAAILLEKMKIIYNEILLRQRVAKRYDQMLSKLVKIPYIPQYNASVYAQYTIEVENRDAFAKS